VSYCASTGIRVNGGDSIIHDDIATFNGSGDSPGIQIGNGVGIGGNNIIYNNVSSYNLGSGYEINWGSTNNHFYNNYGTDNQDQFLEIWDASNNNIIEKNIGANSGGRAIKISGSSDNIVKNNLLITFGLSGIEIGKTEEQEISQRNLIYNNTIIGDGTWTGGIGTRDGSINNVFKNNIVYTTTERAVRVVTVGNTLDNNCYYMASGNMIEYDGTSYTMAQFSTYQTTTGQDANSIAQDPLLRSDYFPQTGSPVIDAGTNDLWESGDEDYGSNPRRMGGTVDIGAYEYYKAKIRNATLRKATI
jgi:parallel beta-helix repeat protein